MPSPHAAINPLLISVLTGQALSDIREKPTVSMLPGPMTKLIARHRKNVPAQLEANKHTLICGHCGSKGQYDLGGVAFNLERWRKDEESETPPSKEDILNYVQTTGYFRCKQCNGAGSWTVKDPVSGAGFMDKLATGVQENTPSYMVGQIVLHDESTPQWATDAEESFLLKLQENVEDGYLWNRLGNLYYKGGRVELAAAAFEKSLQVDPSQVESHFSLSDLLLQVGELEKAAYHDRMMLVYARLYEKLPILHLREMMAAGLQSLFHIHMESDRKIPFMPTTEELALLESFQEAAASTELPALSSGDMEIFPNDRKSFYPMAEMYLWPRRDEIPAGERALDPYLPENRSRSLNRAGGQSSGSRTVVKVRSEEKAKQIQGLCERLGIPAMIRVESTEDVSDLKKALTLRLTPSSVYAPCSCGSGQKFKFCCAAKLKSFDLDWFLERYSGKA